MVEGIFRPNELLHFEDERIYQDQVYRLLKKSLEVMNLLGGNLSQVVSTIDKLVEESSAEAEVDRLIEEIGESSAIIQVVSGQIGRAYLKRRLPSSILSDIAFPINSVQTVEYMIKHGLRDYSLVGFSNKSSLDLDPVVKRFFMETSSVYVHKLLSDELASRVALSMIVNRVRYSQ